MARFIADDYHDQWRNDRALLIDRLRDAFAATRGVRIRFDSPEIDGGRSEVTWRAKISVLGGGEFAQRTIDHVNSLTAPFELRWRRASGKPWDWKLIEIANPEFQLPEQF